MASTNEPKKPVSVSEDRNVINFGKPDKTDPMQWPHSKKIIIVLNVSLLAAFGSMSCSLIAPAVPQIQADFDSTDGNLAVLVVTIFLIGQSVGLLIVSSLSELYGRVVVFQVTNVLFVIFAIATAVANSMGQLIGFRFLLGLAGACPPSIGGGVIGDMFPPQERGRATSIYGFGLILGPLIGPVIGGYLAEAAGWRWTCWLVVILSGAMVFLTALVLRESFRPIVLDRQVRKLRRETGNPDLKAAIPLVGSGHAALMRCLIKPMKLLITTPIVFIPAICVSIVYGFFWLVVATMATVFQEIYGLTEGSSGLAYLGFGVGLVFGNTVFGVASDKSYKAMVRANGGKPKPEMRLIPIMLGSPLAFIGLVMYGWGINKDIHWMLPIVGTAIYGIALTSFMLPVTTYLIEVYRQFAAGPVGANAVLRQLFGGVLPLCAFKLYGSLGQGWGNTLLAFIVLFLGPASWIFYKNGERLREKFPVN